MLNKAIHGTFGTKLIAGLVSTAAGSRKIFKTAEGTADKAELISGIMYLRCQFSATDFQS